MPIALWERILVQIDFQWTNPGSMYWGQHPNKFAIVQLKKIYIQINLHKLYFAKVTTTFRLVDI